jgi:hypothetical protein
MSTLISHLFSNIFTEVVFAHSKPHPDPNCSSHCAAVMKATPVIPRLDQKKVDEIKKVRLALASGKSVLTDAERSAILASVEAMDVKGEYQVQVLLAKIRHEGKGDRILIMKMISSYIGYLESQAARYQKAKSIEAEFRKV